MQRCFQLGLAALLALPSFPQTKSLAQGPHRMELTVERRTGSAWRIVDPGTVFNQDDRVRFRFRTNFDGNLFVMNQGTSGAYVKLFPREDSGTANQIRAGKEYFVPSTEMGAFRVEGPPGHDILYWVMTPGVTTQSTYQPLPPPPPADAKLPATLIPRCDETFLRARGACVDNSAGPQAVQSKDTLPENIRSAANESSQDLVIRKKENTSVVSSPAPLTGPVVYEFRLAHK